MTCSPPRRGDQLARRVEGDDLAVLDDGDAVAEPLGFVHVVRREQHGPAGLAKAADDVPQLPARLRIEAGRRLVEKQKLRIADQCAGDGQPLLLSAGEIANPRLGFLFERNLRHRLFRLDSLPVEAAEERERFADGELFGESCFLQRDADSLPDFIVLLAPTEAQDFDVAGRGVEQPFEDLDRGGLAGAVGSEQAEALALLDSQIETAHGLDRRLAVVALHEIGATNCEHIG